MFDDFKHRGFRLANRQSSDGVAGKIHSDKALRAFPPQIRVDATLYYSEELLPAAGLPTGYAVAARAGSGEVPAAAFGPRERAFHRSVRLRTPGRPAQTIIENHHDVGTEGDL